MFQKVLIANRGEIALRVLRACKELGISTVAVYSTADRNAMHVRMADESVCIGPPPAKDSYLNIPSLLAACEITGADAVHPGYGFLSENARFARILSEHKITFIGPSEHHIQIMGDKITAKQTAVELGIPVVPGSTGEVKTEDEAKKTAAEIGYPVLIKATAGGGGRGMKVAHTEADVLLSWSTARSEAKAAFGNDSVYMEKYLGKPRHIEVQVLGDGQGVLVIFGCLSSHTEARQINASLRSKVINGNVAYVSALTLAETPEQYLDLKMFLGYGERGSDTFTYRDSRRLALPGRGADENPWAEEFDLLNKLADQRIDELEARRSVLSIESTARDGIFWPGLNGPLAIQRALGRLGNPVREAVAAEAGQPHQVHVLHVRAQLQVVEKPAEGLRGDTVVNLVHGSTPALVRRWRAQGRSRTHGHAFFSSRRVSRRVLMRQPAPDFT